MPGLGLGLVTRLGLGLGLVTKPKILNLPSLVLALLPSCNEQTIVGTLSWKALLLPSNTKMPSWHRMGTTPSAPKQNTFNAEVLAHSFYQLCCWYMQLGHYLLRFWNSFTGLSIYYVGQSSKGGNACIIP